jgi:hypothetical protein
MVTRSYPKHPKWVSIYPKWVTDGANWPNEANSPPRQWFTGHRFHALKCPEDFTALEIKCPNVGHWGMPRRLLRMPTSERRAGSSRSRGLKLLFMPMRCRDSTGDEAAIPKGGVTVPVMRDKT